MDAKPDAITRTEAAARFAGVVLLVAIAYLHLLDISHKVEEGIWYMVFLFATLIVGAIVLAAGLVRAAPRSVRLAWTGGALLCIGALGGYFVSRTLALPGMADHQGDWWSLYGVLAVMAELAVVVIAGYAMRELTVRGVRHESSLRLSMIHSSLHSALLLVLIAPQAALAHGGVDDEGDASSGAVDAQGTATPGAEASDGPFAASQTGSSATAGAHGDALLGSAELGLTAFACLGFLGWAGRSLASRAEEAVA